MFNRIANWLKPAEPEEAYPRSVWGGVVRHYRSQLADLAAWSKVNGGNPVSSPIRGSTIEAWDAASVATVHLYGRLLPPECPNWLTDFEGRKNDISLSLSLVFPIFAALSDGLIEERRVRPDEMAERLKETVLSAVTGSWPLFTAEQHVALAQAATRHFSQAVESANGQRFLDEVKLAATLWTAAAADDNRRTMAATEEYLALRFIEMQALLKVG